MYFSETKLIGKQNFVFIQIRYKPIIHNSFKYLWYRRKNRYRSVIIENLGIITFIQDLEIFLLVETYYIMTKRFRYKVHTPLSYSTTNHVISRGVWLQWTNQFDFTFTDRFKIQTIDSFVFYAFSRHSILYWNFLGQRWSNIYKEFIGFVANQFHITS